MTKDEKIARIVGKTGKREREAVAKLVGKGDTYEEYHPSLERQRLAGRDTKASNGLIWTHRRETRCSVLTYIFVNIFWHFTLLSLTPHRTR